MILKEEERDRPLPTLDEAGDQVRQAILREKYFDSVKQLRTEIPVNILDADLKAAVEETTDKYARR